MKFLTERDKRFDGLERRVSRFVLSALLAALLIAVLVAARQGVFTPTTRLYFFTESARSISRNMAVKLSGFKVGSVEDVAMEPNATVKITLAINSEYMRMIGRDAKAKLTKEDFVGESVISIVPGAQNAQQVADGGVLAFERDRDIGEIAEELTHEIKPILQDIKQITAYIKQPDGDVRQTMRNLNKGSALMVETGTQVKALTQNANRQLDVIGGKTSVLLDRAGNTFKTLDASLPPLLRNLESASADIRKLAAESSERVPQLMQDSSALLRDTGEIVGGAKQAWPIRSLVSVPEEKALPMDSYVPNGR